MPNPLHVDPANITHTYNIICGFCAAFSTFGAIGDLTRKYLNQKKKEKKIEQNLFLLCPVATQVMKTKGSKENAEKQSNSAQKSATVKLLYGQLRSKTASPKTVLRARSKCA